ncbi:hypothetical protein FACS1894191_0690 [Clostridia bacterium]|nr:hypothetical protein FACS1894191_0690 [Clostridia bacterium]
MEYVLEIKQIVDYPRVRIYRELIQKIDDRVRGSDLGPVVYYRNMIGEPVTSYSRIASRWGRSRATVCRILGNLEELEYISCLSFSGSQGTLIYLNSYMSTMFGISDAQVDNREVFLTFKLRVRADDRAPEASPESSKILVSKSKKLVSNLLMQILAAKVLETLAVQGFSCCGCRRNRAKLYPLSTACEGFVLEIACTKRTRRKKRKYIFEVRMVDSSG